MGCNFNKTTFDVSGRHRLHTFNQGVHPGTMRCAMNSIRPWRSSVVRALAVATALFVALPSAGQGTRSDDSTEGIDEIRVTITRRDESVQEIASSVSAFSEGQLEEYGVEQLSDVVSLIPGITAKGDRAAPITVRGISQSFAVGAHSPVARHVNGVFRFDNASYLGQFYDLRSVEVVRGPSGTVYGRNATAGAMNVVWNEPHSGYEFVGDALAGNYDRYQFRGVANIPLLGEGDERLMARFVVQREVHDGWLDNLLAPQRQDPEHGDDTYYRLSLKSVLSEDGEITLRTWRHKRAGGEVGSKAGLESFREGRFPPLDMLTGGPPLGQTVPFDAYNGFQNFFATAQANGGLLAILGLVANPGNQIAGMQSVLLTGLPAGGIVPPGGIPPLFGSPSLFTPAPADPSNPRETLGRASSLGTPSTEAWGIDGEFEWLFSDVPILGDVQLNLLGGWESLDDVQLINVDGSSILLVDSLQSTFSQTFVSELRLASASDGPISWIAGLFYMERDFLRQERVNGFFGLAGGDQMIEETGWAPFLNLTWSPIETLEFFGGVRWNRDRVERSEFVGAIAGGAIRPEATLAGRKEIFRETTRELGFRWFFQEDQMFYAKFAKGYKSGFVEIDQSGALFAAGSTNSIAPEILDAWEAGVRTSWLDSTLQVNVTGYFYGYDNLQVPIPLGLQVLTLNAAGATIKGGELELTYEPIPAWNTRLAVSYIDATFNSFCSADSFQFTPADDPGCERGAGVPAPNGIDGRLNLAGNHLEDTPEWQISLTTRLTVPLGEWGTLTSVLSVQFVDDYFARPFNVDSVDGIDSYTQTGIRFIWRSPEGRYTVEVFGTHLEDETIYGRRVVPPEFVANPSQLQLFAPRRFGIRVGFKWGGQ